MLDEQSDAPSAHQMPRRVVDGIGSETVRRRLWCLVVDLLSADDIRDLTALLVSHGRQTALLVEEPDSDGYRSISEACAAHAARPSDTVLVCSGHHSGQEEPQPQGARVVRIGARRPARGELSVANVRDLDALFSEQATYEAASTYHEV